MVPTKSKYTDSTIQFCVPMCMHDENKEVPDRNTTSVPPVRKYAKHRTLRTCMGLPKAHLKLVQSDFMPKILIFASSI
jgi:hypothetical protein